MDKHFSPKRIPQCLERDMAILTVNVPSSPEDRRAFYIDLQTQLPSQTSKEKKKVAGMTAALR
jgi:hypothetical protein